MKVAIVHDWLTNLGGAERVVFELHKAFPDAPIYTSVYKPSALPMFDDAKVKTTWLQKIPGNLKFKHQLWTPLRPRAFRKLDLSEFDVVISSSSAEAKQIRTRADAIHICYCHTPVRYFWVNPEYYKENPGLGPLNIFAPIVMPLFLRSLRKSDYKAAQKVDFFVANSTTVAARIKKYYDRDSIVIHPPVDTSRFKSDEDLERNGFLAVGRQIPYKRVDLAVEAATLMNKKLVVIGKGPEHNNLVELAGETVEFIEEADDQEIVKYFQSAKAFIFPAEEDFGIVPVEAMAAGTPVVAYGKGGATDSVIDGETGFLFNKQTVGSLSNALKKVEKTKFDKSKLVERAEEFDSSRFKDKILDFVRSKRPQ